ncbi:MAG: nuclear transport factor 2 family protein [Actinomycetota bacterium]|nr:nuclear transport factor 2 family protein [Actinomycetota bacterium]
MIELLAPTVVFNSPVTFKPFRGAETVAVVLRGVFEVFEGFHYVDELAGEELHGLVFEARVGERDVSGIDLFRATTDGRIAELTVMVRPLSAVAALAEAMAPKVAALAKG